MTRAGGTMSYRLRLVQPGTGAGYFVTEPITPEPEEAHRLTPASPYSRLAATRARLAAVRVLGLSLS
jgi:hypothetical protein